MKDACGQGLERLLRNEHAPWKTIFLYKQGGFHFHVSSRDSTSSFGEVQERLRLAVSTSLISAPSWDHIGAKTNVLSSIFLKDPRFRTSLGRVVSFLGSGGSG